MSEQAEHVLGSKLVRWQHTRHPSTWDVWERREGQEFKVVVSCVMSSKPVWGLWDAVSKDRTTMSSDCQARACMGALRHTLTHMFGWVVGPGCHRELVCLRGSQVVLLSVTQEWPCRDGR